LAHKTYFGKGRISYFNIKEGSGYSIGVLSAGMQLKLHDHPNMLVLSKLLTGKIHRRAMDLIDTTLQVKLPQQWIEGGDDNVLGKELDGDRFLEAGEMVYLTPFKGNIHSFMALEDTAILDVLVPNYERLHRFCNYYEEVFKNGGQDNSSNKGLLDGFFGKFAKGNKSNELDKSPANAEIHDVLDRRVVDHKLKTRLKYMLPPEDLEIKILPYRGEPF